jgi:hypothetical protein
MRGGSGHFVIVASSFLRNFHCIHCGKVLIGEFGNVHRAPIQAPEALIFLGGEQHDIVAAMAGDYHCFTMGNAA